jgi:DNA-binding beta-propeller fold protein YncE
MLCAIQVIETPGVRSACNGIAVMVLDGEETLLVSGTTPGTGCFGRGSHGIHKFRVVDGVSLGVVGRKGRGELEFNDPHQVWAAAVDSHWQVFVADYGNNRVQVLTPRLDFHSFIGEGRLRGPAGVCADSAHVFVSERDGHRISVFNRADGRLIRHIGDHDGTLLYPRGLCLMRGGLDGHIAVADCGHDRVCIFGVDDRGDWSLTRCVGWQNLRGAEHTRDAASGRAYSVLKCPTGVACSAAGELVVADNGNHCVRIFGRDTEATKPLHAMFGHGPRRRVVNFTGVAVRGGSVFAQGFTESCVVFDNAVY